MYGGLVYASSNMRMSAVFLLPMAVSKPDTQLWIHASPDATELSCMLCPSFGVNQMKFGCDGFVLLDQPWEKEYWSARCVMYGAGPYTSFRFLFSMRTTTS